MRRPGSSPVVSVGRKFYREEEGFTLTEVLVTMVMMILVMFALYTIFDMSIRVFSFGNDKVEAVENARIGLAKMEREIRAAYPYDKISDSSPDEQLLKVKKSTKIEFGNDLNGNRKVDDECSSESPPCEIIAYSVYKPKLRGSPYALGRSNSVPSVREAVVEFIDYKKESDPGVSFSYLKWDAADNDFVEAVEEGEVELVRITLRVRVGEGSQTLSTDVALRNRGT